MKANIVHLLREVARQTPDRTALVMPRGRHGETLLTFGDLWLKICRFSAALQQHGFGSGQRAIIMIPMSPELYIAMLAVIKAGGVAVFADPWVHARQLAAFSAFAEPTTFIGIPKAHLLRLLQRRLRHLPLTISVGPTCCGIPARHSFNRLLAAATLDEQVHEVEPGDSALITFTSGSSGIPKGANRTHGFLIAQHQALATEFPQVPGTVDMPMFPVFALRNLADGITSVIPDMDFKAVNRVDATRIHAQMERHGVQSCTASPPFFDRLASLANPPPLRRILTGGAPVTDDQLRAWRQAFASTTIEVVYGSTEAEPVAHIDAATRLGLDPESPGFCTGKPTALLRTRIIRISKAPLSDPLAWQEWLLPPGQIGELLVAGNHVCIDYFRNPDAVRENKVRDADGTIWHRMGDTGYLDAAGRFWLVGRVHSTILRAGVQYHAQLIEQAARQAIPACQRVAALGVPDSQLGEALVLVLESIDAPPANLQLDAPVDRIICMPTLPLDPRHNAKIDYARLRQLVRR